MKADWNDAPGYLKRPRKRGAAKLIPGLIGILITLALLQMASSAFLKGTVQGIVDKRTQPKPTPIAEITRADPAATKDWDRVVEEVAARGATPHPQTALSQTARTELPPVKQIVFNDANYIPRGAENVVAPFKKQHVELRKPSANKEITIVGQKRHMKDQACWPHAEGSIERRNCRLRVGLDYRD